MIEALRYKLICFGVPVDGTTELCCDNKSVMNNSSISTSVLNQRHNYICHHKVSAPYDAGALHVEWLPGEFNPP